MDHRKKICCRVSWHMEMKAMHLMVLLLSITEYDSQGNDSHVVYLKTRCENQTFFFIRSWLPLGAEAIDYHSLSWAILSISFQVILICCTSIFIKASSPCIPISTSLTFTLLFPVQCLYCNILGLFPYSMH